MLLVFVAFGVGMMTLAFAGSVAVYGFVRAARQRVGQRSH
jgi:hypothetical protein